MKCHWSYFALPALSVCLFLGCGSSSQTVKVSGVVTLDGKPLPEALVVFNPDSDKGIPASAVTGSDGSFRLTTFASGDGAMPGSYKITVTMSKSTEGDGTQAVSGDPQSMIEAMKAHQEKNKNKPKGPVKGSLPATYSDLKKTNLKYVVPPPDGKVVLELFSTGS